MILLRGGLNNLRGSTAQERRREQVLHNLLQIELREAIRGYLSRTRRTYPIRYVFDLSDIHSS